MNPEQKFSTYNRKWNLQQMAETQLDLFVIGGGITGAGIALDAASRGLKVGLVEKQDFAAGTSSRSTKLVHGGLRYLKQLEINLVREVGRERAIAYRNAPHLVLPEKMLLPLVERGTFGKFSTSIGLWIYDYLAGVVKEERRTMQSKEQTEQLEPLLRRDILKGGGLYIEYRTDDARLTVEILKTAVRHGALGVNYAETTGFIYQDQTIAGVEVTDVLTGEIYKIYAKKIVNAAGPWVDQLREKDDSLYGKRLHLTKGVHLVFSQTRFPLRQAVYFDVSDGRMIFAIPRDNAAYVGTTDTNYQGSLEKPRVTREDVEYLLNAVNHMFPSLNLRREDITSSWAGLRPLIHEDGKSPSELSRKDEIFHSPTGLLTIAGGKLTGYRKMAERVVDLVAGKLSQAEGRFFKPCHTDQIALTGGDFQSPAYIPKYVESLADSLIEFGVTEQQVQMLVHRYGTQTEIVLKLAEELFKKDRYQDAALVLLVAEARYGINEEMAATLSDVLIRRTGKLFFERETLDNQYRTLLEEMASLLQWDEEEKMRNLQEFEAEYTSAVKFD